VAAFGGIVSAISSCAPFELAGDAPSDAAPGDDVVRMDPDGGAPSDARVCDGEPRTPCASDACGRVEAVFGQRDAVTAVASSASRYFFAQNVGSSGVPYRIYARHGTAPDEYWAYHSTRFSAVSLLGDDLFALATPYVFQRALGEVGAASFMAGPPGELFAATTAGLVFSDRSRVFARAHGEDGGTHREVASPDDLGGDVIELAAAGDRAYWLTEGGPSARGSLGSLAAAVRGPVVTGLTAPHSLSVSREHVVFADAAGIRIVRASALGVVETFDASGVAGRDMSQARLPRVAADDHAAYWLRPDGAMTLSLVRRNFCSARTDVLVTDLPRDTAGVRVTRERVYWVQSTPMGTGGAAIRSVAR